MVKIAGSLALLLTVTGLLLAIGGQFDFLGNKRPEAVAVQPVRDYNLATKAKYTFYDELKRRKTEIDGSNAQAAASRTLQVEKKPVLTTADAEQAQVSDQVQYVVQVGAFSRQADAEKVKNKVVSMGYSGRVVRGVTGGRKFLAQAGPVMGWESAVATEQSLKAQGLPTLIKRVK